MDGLTNGTNLGGPEASRRHLEVVHVLPGDLNGSSVAGKHEEMPVV